MALAQLDTEKFAKVQALARKGATAGEREAASSRLDAMAKAAGFTTAQAIRATKAAARLKPKAPPKAPPSSASEAADLFNAFFNSPEMKARAAERNRERAIKRAKVLQEYGSEDAVWADTTEETTLKASVEHLLTMSRWSDGEEYISGIAGWDGFGLDKMSAEVRFAIRQALPWPATVAGLWEEHQRWDKLSGDRLAFDDSFEDWFWVQAREQLLEEALSVQPASSADDILSRFAWMQFIHDRDMSWERKKEPERLATLRDDVSRLMGAIQSGQAQGSAECADPSKDSKGTHTVRTPPPVHSGHSTAAGRRAHVMSILGAEGDTLSDREIARRTGVSPTTVGKLRRGRP